MEQYHWLDQMLEKYCRNTTQKQKTIIKAAIALFGEKGYASTSTREIAKMAGVAEGTIFKHYATKKDLMLKISEMIMGDMLTALVTTDLDEIMLKEYDSVESLLMALMRNRLRLLEQGIPIYKVLIQEVPFHPELRKMMVKKLENIPIPKTFESIRSKEMLADLTDQEIIMMAITCIYGFLNIRYVLLPEYYIENPGYDPDSDLKKFVQFMVRGLTISKEGPKRKAGNDDKR